MTKKKNSTPKQPTFARRGVPSIVEVKPCGSSILVELLNEDEMLGTILEFPAGASSGGDGILDAPQAYVKATGPRYNPEEWGFDVGDRIMLTGHLTPAPNFNKQKRATGTVEPHFVKAVLVEAE